MTDSSERNKHVVRRLYGEVMAKGNIELAEEVFRDDYDDYVDHMPIMETPDREGLLRSVEAAGKPVTWTETHFWRVVDGRIAEHYGNVSLFEVHKMIGSHDIDGELA